MVGSLRMLMLGGGGGGKKWHHDGRRTQKTNSIKDYISCAKFLVDREIVHENKLAGWGHSAGGLMVASAVNQSPYLFKAAILKLLTMKSLDTLGTLMIFTLYVTILLMTIFRRMFFFQLS